MGSDYSTRMSSNVFDFHYSCLVVSIMKSLFRNDYRYTDDAIMLDVELNDVIKPIMEEYINNGFSPREVEYVAQSTVTLIALMFILEYKGKE